MINKSLVRARALQSDVNSQVGRDGNDSVGNLVTQVRLGGLLHLLKNHSADLFRGEDLVATLDLDLDSRFAALLDDLRAREEPTAKRVRDCLLGKKVI